MEFDTGGMLSLIATLLIVVLIPILRGKNFGDFKKYLKTTESSSSLIINLALLVTAITAIWLSIRAGGLLLKNYFFENDYPYSQYQILDLVSYILIANLCFSLIKMRTETQIRDIASAAIQATVIGIVIFLPKITSDEFIDVLNPRLNGVIGIFLIAGSIALILFSLAVFWKYIEEHKPKTTTKEDG